MNILSVWCIGDTGVYKLKNQSKKLINKEVKKIRISVFDEDNQAVVAFWIRVTNDSFLVSRNKWLSLEVI
jgi:hypothetical protein